MPVDLDNIGGMADEADNYLVYATDMMAGLPTDMRLDALRRGLTSIRDGLRREYIAGGGDPTTWAFEEVQG